MPKAVLATVLAVIAAALVTVGSAVAAPGGTGHTVTQTDNFHGVQTTTDTNPCTGNVIDLIARAWVRVGRRLAAVDVVSLRDGMARSSRRRNSRSDRNQRCGNDCEHRRKNCFRHKTPSPRLTTYDARELAEHPRVGATENARR